MSEQLNYIATSILIIVLAWVFKVTMKRFSKRVIETEKPHPQSIAGFLHKHGQPLPSSLSGKEIVKLARITARIGDLVFWIVLFCTIIFLVFIIK